MSYRGTKPGGAPAPERREPAKALPKTDGERPSDLPEILHNGWRAWDDNMLRLKAYLNRNYPEMNSIIADPMILDAKAEYKAYPEIEFDIEKYESIEEGKITRTMMVNEHKELAGARRKKLERQQIEKGQTYYLIRSMCSAGLNAILIVEPKFTKLKNDDPLGLLEIIKKNSDQQVRRPR
jgi:hypothetical protein